MTLREIIDRIKSPPTYNVSAEMRALESYCLGRRYADIREAAVREGVDLDELEELLARL